MRLKPQWSREISIERVTVNAMAPCPVRGNAASLLMSQAAGGELATT